MNELISAPEAAQILGVSRQHVINLYKEGKLPAYMVIGTPIRPRPLFNRQKIVVLARERKSVVKA